MTLICCLEIIYMYTHQQNLSNTWWWNCEYRNCSKTWAAGCTKSAHCTNLPFTPFDASNVIVFLIPQHWFALEIFHRRLKWDIFVSTDSTRNEFMEQCWAISFTDPCDVSDDVILGHVKIRTCDMLSVFPCIRFILIRRLLLKTIKGTPNDRFLPNGCENTVVGAV